jgi:hypothetical protein
VKQLVAVCGDVVINRLGKLFAGENVFFTLIDRSIPNIHPFGNPALRADGKAASYSTSPGASTAVGMRSTG